MSPHKEKDHRAPPPEDPAAKRTLPAGAKPGEPAGGLKIPVAKAIPGAPGQAPRAETAAKAPAEVRGPSLQERFLNLLRAKPSAPAKGLWGFASQRPRHVEEEDTLSIDAVQMILEEAVAQKVSDIHIEPLEEVQRVRMRVDGVLEEVLEVPRALNMRLISRIRVLCGLDPEAGVGSSKPQDGRTVAVVDNEEVDIRLSTYPTIHGEKAVLRVINRKMEVLELDRLGLKAEYVAEIRKLISRPHGMVIVTGPAGNGKTTTLYTILQTLNIPGRNIVTLEDPVERQIPGINQSAVQVKTGFTFAEGLRAILRQDPNIIMLGEIRDQETAEISLSASLTGHLLFTTLHTNNAVGAITRLLDMGLEPYLITSALTATFAQRLARRICAGCREFRPPAPEVMAAFEDLCKRSGIEPEASKLPQPYAGRGCAFCRGTGYRGRILLFEMCRMSPAMRLLVLRKAPAAEFHELSIRENLETMLHDGISKIREGLTSYEEVLRVVGSYE